MRAGEATAAQAFAVPILRDWLVVDRSFLVKALMNGAALAALREGAAEAGLMSELGRALDEYGARPVPLQTGPADPPFLGIIPTRDCNAACKYCAFADAREPGQMSPELARAAVDSMASLLASAGRSTLAVHFFGGEPLVAADVVRVAVASARAAALERGLGARFEIATNGVVDERVRRFLAQEFDLVVLSLDGAREAHDLHRPMASGLGSFEAAARTARVLSEGPCELCLRVCVSEANVAFLPEIVSWFAEAFHPSSIDVEPLRPSDRSRRHLLRAPDPYRFASSFRRAAAVGRRRGIEVLYAAAQIAKAPRSSLCPVGEDAFIVSPEGEIRACYLPPREWETRGLDLVLGRFEGSGFHIEPERLSAVRSLVRDKPGCERCFCRWSCAGGCHVSHVSPALSDAYDDSCVATRILTACALLDVIGSSEVADALVASREGMEALALAGCDRL